MKRYIEIEIAIKNILLKLCISGMIPWLIAERILFGIKVQVCRVRL